MIFRESFSEPCETFFKTFQVQVLRLINDQVIFTANMFHLFTVIAIRAAIKANTINNPVQFEQSQLNKDTVFHLNFTVKTINYKRYLRNKV